MVKVKQDCILIKPEDIKPSSPELDNLRVIFPTGLLMDENKRDLLIYSGAGDRVTSVKKVSLKNILKKLRSVKVNQD